MMKPSLDELESKFDKWLQTIVDVLKVPMTKIDLARNAGQIGDYTLEDFKRTVDEAVALHLSKINPHELTLQQLGALSESELMGLFIMYQNKFRIPLTLIESLNGRFSVDWNANRITIQSITPTLIGAKTTVPLTTLALSTTNVHYVMLEFTKGAKEYEVSYSVSNTPTVTWTKIPLLKIDRTARTVQTRRIVRIGENELSRTPAGTTIPVSSGTSQSATGTIGANWFT